MTSVDMKNRKQINLHKVYFSCTTISKHLFKFNIAGNNYHGIRAFTNVYNVDYDIILHQKTIQFDKNCSLLGENVQ